MHSYSLHCLLPSADYASFAQMRERRVAARAYDADLPAGELVAQAIGGGQGRGAGPFGQRVARSIIHTMAWRISSSVRSRNSASISHNIACGSAKPAPVPSPSAKVSFGASASRRSREEMYAAGERSACTPITRVFGAAQRATSAAPAAPLPPPMGTKIAAKSGWAVSISSACGCHARDQQWFVTGMDVAAAVLASEGLAMDPRLVKVRPVKNHFSPHPLHGGHLAGIGLARDDNPGAYSEQPRGVRHRLPVIATGDSNQAAPSLLFRQLRDEIHTTAHFEGADRLIVLVLDECRRPQQVVHRRI